MDHTEEILSSEDNIINTGRKRGLTWYSNHGKVQWEGFEDKWGKREQGVSNDLVSCADQRDDEWLCAGSKEIEKILIKSQFVGGIHCRSWCSKNKRYLNPLGTRGISTGIYIKHKALGALSLPAKTYSP
jgi:hypothetical protein